MIVKSLILLVVAHEVEAKSGTLYQRNQRNTSAFRPSFHFECSRWSNPRLQQAAAGERAALAVANNEVVEQPDIDQLQG